MGLSGSVDSGGGVMNLSPALSRQSSRGMGGGRLLMQSERGGEGG